MSVPQHVHDEIRRLLWALRDGDFSADDSQKLQQLLTGDPEARELYVWYSFLCGSLTWDHSAGREEVAEHEIGYEEKAGLQAQEVDENSAWRAESEFNQESENCKLPSTAFNPPPPVSIILDNSSPLAPTASPFYVSHPFLFSNTFALLVTGLGLLAAWFYQVDIPHEGAGNSRSAVISKNTAHRDSLEFVGRVTNLIDVMWSDAQTATVHGANVSLGRKFALAAGLMEITYDSGATVILEGPVTYEVDSRDGGFLARGKLTARLTKGSEGLGTGGGKGAGSEGGRQSATVAGKKGSGIRGQGSGKVTGGQWPVASKEGSGIRGQGSGKVASGQWLVASEANPKSQISNSQISNPQSLIPNPSFTVRTPSATVTDLGTEFGVEVHPSGATSAYVFQGAIELKSLVKNSKAVRLVANESAQVDSSDDGQNAEVRRIAINPASFVRSEKLAKMARKPHEKWKPTSLRRWQSASQELRRDPSLLAYYDFQQQNNRPTVLPNVAGNGNSKLDGAVENVTWSDGRMSGKHALQFNSASDYVQIKLPQKVDDLTLAAWIQVQSLDEGQIGLLMSSGWGQLGQIHWQLTDDGRIALDAYDTSGREWIYKSEPVFDRQRYYHWTHIAVVYDHVAGLVRFYADGKPMGEKKIIMITPLCIGEARIGQWNQKGFLQQQGAGRAFHGRIDEMAIFGRSLSAGEIKHLFESGIATVSPNSDATSLDSKQYPTETPGAVNLQTK